MTSNNEYLKTILERLTTTIEGDHSDNYYLVRIAAYYGCTYLDAPCNGKLYKDIAEAITEVEYSGNHFRNFYLKEIAEEVYSGELTSNTDNYYLKIISENIEGEGLYVSLSSSTSSVTYGDTVTLTASVTQNGAPVTGVTVTFKEGNTTLGTGTTNSSGDATYSSSGLSVGSHSLSAIYDEATSNTVSITVNKVTSTITLTGSNITYGADVSLTGTLSVGSGKSVKIYQGNTLIDTVTTSTGGAFSKSVSGLAVGSYTFKASYDGDLTHEGVTSEDVTIIVSKTTPTITFATSSSIVYYGDTYTLSGTLSAGSGKSVKIYDGSTVIDTVITGEGGVFTKSMTASAIDTKSYSAVFEGDSDYDGVTSSAVTVYLKKIMPSATFDLPSTGTAGTAFTISGTFNFEGATLKILEGANETVVGTTIVSGGEYSISLTKNVADTYSYRVKYDGDSIHDDYKSAAKSIVISPAPTPTPASMTLTSDKSILSYADGESATLTATVLDSNSQGVSGETVEFFAGSTSLGTATTNSSGVATKTYASAGVGDVTLSAECRLLIQTYSIEDCLKVGFKSTDTFHAIASSNSMTVTDGVATGYNKLTDYTVPMSSDFEITIDYQCSRSEGGLVFADLTNTNNSDKNTYQILTQGSTDGINFNGYTNTTRSFHKTISSSSGLNQYNTIKFVKQSGTVSAYFNGTLIGSNSVLNNGITDLCIGMYRWNTSNTQSMKNLKIKPL